MNIILFSDVSMCWNVLTFSNDLLAIFIYLYLSAGSCILARLFSGTVQFGSQFPLPPYWRCSYGLSARIQLGARIVQWFPKGWAPSCRRHQTAQNPSYPVHIGGEGQTACHAQINADKRQFPLMRLEPSIPDITPCSQCWYTWHDNGNRQRTTSKTLNQHS